MLISKLSRNAAVTPLQSSVLCVGDFRVDPSLDEISRDGATVKLEPRAMRVLVCLADHAGEVVSVEQLLDAVWKDVLVTHDSVYQAVAELRINLNWIRDPKIREAAMKALALDPSLAEAHMSLAQVKFFNDWDWPGAESEFSQATALKPSDAYAHYLYSNYLVAMGRLDEAMKEIEHARDLDPFSAPGTWWLGQVLYHARRYDDALRENRRGLEMRPDSARYNAMLYAAMADVYEQKKMFAEAFAARQQALSLNKDPNVTELGEAYKHSGYRGYLLKQAQFLDQAPILDDSHDPAYAAHLYALLDDEARAMTALEAGYSEREPGILFMRSAPNWTPFAPHRVSAT
jgi:tetratricopeptide (TPR) repeat protein